MPELDAVRGFAATVVMLHHLFPAASTPIAGVLHASVRFGWLGVDVFFILSGFLITGILRDSRDRIAYYREFYIRRAFRIFPLYYVSAAVAIGVLVACGSPPSARAAWCSLAFVANMGAFLGFTLTGPLTVYWSLAVEEHFYLVWPWIVKTCSRGALLAIVVGAYLLSPLARYAAAARYGDWLDVYFVTFFRLDALALGAAIALFVAAPGKAVRAAKRFAWVSAATGLSLGLALVGNGAHSRRGAPLVAALEFTAADLVIAGAFVAVLVASRRQTRRSGILKPLGFLGDQSYFIYLNHLLCVELADAAAARLGLLPGGDLFTLLRACVVLGATLAIAMAARRWFEVPMLTVRDRVLAGLEHRVRGAAAPQSTVWLGDGREL